MMFLQMWQIHPTSGPEEGGTRLTIIGRNLGKFEDNVEVSIDGVECSMEEFEAPRK